MNRFDLFVFVCFAGFACLCQGLFWRGGQGAVLISSDGGNIASFAAASDHPELFNKDELLQDKKIYRLYTPWATWLIRHLSRFTGNYASALQILTGPVFALHLFGFYILGLVVLQSRRWAIVYAFLTLVPIEIQCLQEYWGGLFFPDAVPRVYFQSLIPYVLASFIYWRTKPMAWFLSLLVTGLLAYIHPISALVWGFAIWFGIGINLKPEWSRARRFITMISLAFVFFASTVYLIFNSLTNSVRGTGVNYEAIYRVFTYRFHPSNFNVAAAFGHFIWFATYRLILPCAVTGAYYLLKRSQAQERKKVLIIACWGMGLIATSVFLPAIEQEIVRAYRVLPFTIAFQRGLRYLVPLMMLFCIWPLAAMSRERPLKKKNKAILSLAVVAIILWSSRYIYHFVNYILKNEYNVFIGHARPKAHDLMDALEAVKISTPPGSLIFTSLPDPLAVRYYALRPLVAVHKDGASLLYTNPQKALVWYEEMRKVDSLSEKYHDKDSQGRIAGFIALAREFKAQFLLVDARISPESVRGWPATIVYANDSFALLKINNS